MTMDPVRVAARAAGLAACLALALSQPGAAQPGPGNGPPANGPPRFPMTIEADARVQQKSYPFAPTGEEMKYTLFVSSKVRPDVPAPLIVALHGLGGDSNFIVRGRLVDLAEEGGYVVVGPMGYNAGGWYGSPLIAMPNQPPARPNLTELSELDVLTVLQIARSQFNVDPDRIYLMGHSMGGAGTIYLGQKHADYWAAIAAIAPAAFMMQREQAGVLAPIKGAGLPVMITQGSDDPVVPAANTRTWAAALAELGIEHEYLEMAGRDHGNIIGDGMPDDRHTRAETRRAMLRGTARRREASRCVERPDRPIGSGIWAIATGWRSAPPRGPMPRASRPCWARRGSRSVPPTSRPGSKPCSGAAAAPSSPWNGDRRAASSPSPPCGPSTRRGPSA